MNIGSSQDNSAAHAICVNNEEIKTYTAYFLYSFKYSFKLIFYIALSIF